MKVAITSRGNTANALIDSRFGRCAFFALYDTESKALEFVENTAKNAERGAGPAAVSLVANKGVRKVISGEFGFKVKEILSRLNIQMVIVKEDKAIREIVDLLNN